MTARTTTADQRLLAAEKAWTERAVLLQSPLWMAAVGWVMLTGRLATWADRELLIFSTAAALPALVVPALVAHRRHPRNTRRPPLLAQHWLKLNVWVFLVVCWGSYFGSHYFFRLMGMRYNFPAVRLTLDSDVLRDGGGGGGRWRQRVPLFLYPLTHAYFMTYFAVLQRAERAARALLPLRDSAASRALAVVAASYAVAYAETFFMAADCLARYFWYRDRARMLSWGSLGYAMYFVAGLPMVRRVDGGGQRWSLGRTVREAAATCMAIQVLLEVWAKLAGPL
ncbi:hypothetical protein RB595_008698 [Gaeumannomyces hyphopodioides]